jgi:hypothetical protein
MAGSAKTVPEEKSPARKLQPFNMTYLFNNGGFFRKDMGEEKPSTYCGSATY